MTKVLLGNLKALLGFGSSNANQNVTTDANGDLKVEAKNNHSHGQINKDGKVSTTTSTVGNVVVTDGSNIVKVINKLPAANVTHQDISGKLDKTQSSNKDKMLVTDASTGEIKFVAKNNNQLTNGAGYITSSDIPTGSTLQAGILQLGTGSSNAATGNHGHGQIDKDGKVSTTTSTVGNVVVTDGSNVVKVINKLPAANVTHQDISGKLDKTQSSNKGKMLVTNASTGEIEFVAKNNNQLTNGAEYITASDIPTGSTLQAGILQLGTGSSNAATGDHTHDGRYYTKTQIDSSNCGTFTELQTLINNASSGDVIALDKDYKNSGNETYITIGKSLTIIGNGHIIDADNKSSIFQINKNTILNGISFYNSKGGDSQPGAIMVNSTIVSVVISNCNFYNNTLGCIRLFSPNNIIDHCTFNKNTTSFSGGAIYIANNIATSNIISNCNFNENYGVLGGAIYLYNKNNNIINCNFNNNSSENGPNIYSYESGAVIYNCHVTTGLYNCTNQDYLVSHQDISGKANSADLSSVATSGSYKDLSDKPTVSAGSVSSSDSGAYKVADIKLDGINTVSLYGIDTDTIYSHPDKLSNAITTSSIYKTKIDKQGHITEATSVTIDSSPANNANNLISSKGVYDALNNKLDSTTAASTYQPIGDYFTSSDIGSASSGTSTNTSSSKLVSCADSRLSDAREPTSHTHHYVTSIELVDKAVDSTGKIILHYGDD